MLFGCPQSTTINPCALRASRLEAQSGNTLIPATRYRAKVRRLFYGALIFALVSMFTSPSYSQVLYGSLVGTVTDQSGAVVPGATISVTDTQTGQTRVETSDSGGRYNVVNLTPGTYKVATAAKGFRDVEQSGLTITPNTVSRIDFHLEVGQAAETVTVSGTTTSCRPTKLIPTLN